MDPLAALIQYEIVLFLGALALIISIQFLTGKINRRRLLYAKGRAATDDSAQRKTNPSTERRTNGLSPSRLQLLVVSVGVAIYLLFEVVRNPSQYPEIPLGILLLMAGSEIIYLASKANNLSRRRTSNSET